MASLPTPPPDRSSFKVAIFCALPVEANTVESLFDIIWDENGSSYGKLPGDPNTYMTGAMGRHNVVLTRMPGIGKRIAARTAARLSLSFPGVKLAFVVGVCGGVPFGAAEGQEIVRGDVIIGEGVVQFDFGRMMGDEGFVRRDGALDNLGPPPEEIRCLLARLKGSKAGEKLRRDMGVYLGKIEGEMGDKVGYPGVGEDILFHTAYVHREQSDWVCACRMSKSSVGYEALISRRRIRKLEESGDAPTPQIHFGLFASGDTVMESAWDRDIIANREGIIAFEMEAAGVWDIFPCVTIKGVCDYADGHWSDPWLNYAAATGAACMRAFLEQWAFVEEPCSGDMETFSTRTTLASGQGEIYQERLDSAQAASLGAGCKGNDTLRRSQSQKKAREKFWNLVPLCGLKRNMGGE